MSSDNEHLRRQFSGWVPQALLNPAPAPAPVPEPVPEEVAEEEAAPAPRRRRKPAAEDASE